MFRNCTSLTSVDLTGVDFPSVTVATQWFQSSGITSFDSSGFSLPLVTAGNGGNAFNSCASLAWLNASAWQDTAAGDSFCSGCTSLESAYFPNQKSISGYQFRNCGSLVCLIFGLGHAYQSGTIGTNAFQNSPLATSGGGGYIYVRDSEVSTYKNANYFRNYADNIKGISECPQAYLDLYHIDPSDYQ
jgi:surface protein